MPNNNQPRFLGYLHSFRGFAIINIVAIHCFVFAIFGSNNFNFGEANAISFINDFLFHNSTIYFAVISVVLFTAILKNKGYNNFFTGKIKHVLLPYVFFTLLFSILSQNSNNPLAVQPDFFSYLKAVLRNFVYGKALAVYWYIPVLIFLYLATPLLDYIINLKTLGKPLFAVFMLAPLVVSRVELVELVQGDFLSLKTMIYFMGAYAAGMYFGKDLEAGLTWIQKNLVVFIIFAVLSSAALIYFYIKGIDKTGPVSLLASMYYIQKMCISAIVIQMLKKLEENQPRWLHRIAKDSFTIFFLHAFFLFIVMSLIMPLLTLKKIAPFNIIVGGIIMIIGSIALSMLIAAIFRKLFGKKSRMIVGS